MEPDTLTKAQPKHPAEGVTHYEMCCFPGEALCGEDLTRHTEVLTDVDCVVCLDLAKTGLGCAATRASR